MTHQRWKPLEVPDDRARDLKATREMVSQIVPHVAAMIVEGTAEQEPFTGVLVEHADRFFIATAQHCLEDLEGPDGLHLLGVGRIRSTSPIGAEVMGSGYATNEGDSPGECDTAFMELRRDFASELTANGAKWLGFDQMISDVCDPGCDVVFLGFPRDRLQPHPAQPRLTVIRPSVYCSRVAERAPKSYSECDELFDRFEPGMHILLEQPDAAADFDGNPSESIDSTDGMSGSGVFLLPSVAADGTWSASDANLVGIYTGDFPRRLLMFVQRIEILKESIRQYVRLYPYRDQPF